MYKNIDLHRGDFRGPDDLLKHFWHKSLREEESLKLSSLKVTLTVEVKLYFPGIDTDFGAIRHVKIPVCHLPAE